MKTRCTILAKGAPNRLRDGRKVMCAIALAESELGLFRMYPLQVVEQRDIKVWSVIDCDCVEAIDDSRAESFRVRDVNVVGEVTSSLEKRDLLDACVLRSGEVDPLRFQNDRRKSICVVKPRGTMTGQMELRSECDRWGDVDDWCVMAQSDFQHKPIVAWSSEQGVDHKTHAVSQEVYMWLRKHPNEPYSLFNNLRFADRDYDHWLVLGNMKKRRNVWVAAHIHRLKKTTQRYTGRSFLTSDGRNAGWPYSEQKEGNVKPVEIRQKSLFTI